MTSNVDVKDHLINGAFVEVVDFEHKCNNDGHNYVHAVLVKFDKSKCGENLRKTRPDLRQRYSGENITPVYKYQMTTVSTGKIVSDPKKVVLYNFL